jgi:SNF2 family DNA or RNA helicase
MMYGFTPAQLKSLYAQIMAFKTIMKRQTVPKKVAEIINPPPLPGYMGPQLSQQQQAAMRQNYLNAQQKGHGGKQKQGGGAKGKRAAAQAYQAGKGKGKGMLNNQPQLSEDDFESQLNAMRMFTANKKMKGEDTGGAGGSGGAAAAMMMNQAPQMPMDPKNMTKDEIEHMKRMHELRMKIEQAKYEKKAKMAKAMADQEKKGKTKTVTKAQSAAEAQALKKSNKAAMKEHKKQQKEMEKAMKKAEKKAEKERKKELERKMKAAEKERKKKEKENLQKKREVEAKELEKKRELERKHMEKTQKKLSQNLLYQYQSKLNGLPKPPPLPSPDVTPSLVDGTFKDSGNIVSCKTSREATEIVATLMNEETDRRRDVQVDKVTEDLAQFISSNRKKQKPVKLMKYSITLKALKLRKLQRRLREEVILNQLEMQPMKTKEFYRTARLCESKRIEMNKQDEYNQSNRLTSRLKDLRKVRQQWVDMCYSNLDKTRTNTKRLMQFHAQLSTEFNKVEKEDRRKKMLRALEEKDAEAYAKLVRDELGGSDKANKSELDELTKFLDETELYLKDLGDKVKMVKLQSAVEEGDISMADTITIQNENGGAGDNNQVGGDKLYDAAHSLEHEIQLPHLLSPPGLRSYQVTGLKWMTSLYKNHLNGILADEMGLGKTVQVIALFAWLMEYERNMGPHLVIVPNAVVPNWRNEIKRWLPAATTCVYIGQKDIRNEIFDAHISLDATYRSNVVITTYEFALRDRAKLAKVDWKYVVMDEAHRIKDRASKLADAVDKLQCDRRLLLTGTPLQNDLQELWSLLNYLLPKVFDEHSKKAFREWFDEHLTNQHEFTEEKLAKRAVVIQRLHQALEPFMLRRQVEDVEQSLPPKVAHTILCASSSLESVAYRWLSQTSTVRDVRGGFFAINNKAMELKKLCNHLIMAYPEAVLDHSMTELIRSSGKLFMLDRILMKMFKSGHRVLLFSTMTKALDILETYVRSRKWSYHRIDGTTSIEDREDAIADFNNVNRDDGKDVPFIFLLSIRAAGRGLNLQSADTVILYDPDPNPKNEEQAIARSHRIGQVREVRIFHLESVIDTEVPTLTEDDDEDNVAMAMEEDNAENVAEKQGRGGYMDSVESIIRKEIQKYKIDMANEVIDAGRFDLQSSKEEKRKTLQSFLQEHVTATGDNYIISMKEVNRLMARSAEEIRLFDQLDKDEDLWAGSLYTSIHDVPSWLQFSKEDEEKAHNMLGHNRKKMAPELEKLLIYGSRYKVE